MEKKKTKKEKDNFSEYLKNIDWNDPKVAMAYIVGGVFVLWIVVWALSKLMPLLLIGGLIYVAYLASKQKKGDRTKKVTA